MKGNFKPDESWTPMAVEFFQGESDKITFEVSRSNERAADRRNRTFSKESVEFLHEQIWTFVSARLMARWKKEGKAPIKMRVNVSIDFGDKNQRTS